MPWLQGWIGYVNAIDVVEVPTPVPTRTTAAVGQVVSLPVVTSLKATEKLVFEPCCSVKVVGASFAAGVRKLAGLPDEGTSTVRSGNVAPARFSSPSSGQPFRVHDPLVVLVRVKDV